MDFDRPWLKHGLVSEEVAVCWEPKNILRVALALPNKRQYDPEIHIIDARMKIIAKIWYWCLNMTCQNGNVRKGNMSTVAPPGIF